LEQESFEEENLLLCQKIERLQIKVMLSKSNLKVLLIYFSTVLKSQIGYNLYVFPLYPL